MVLLLSLALFADSSLTVDSLVATVRTLAKKHKDADVAESLDRLQLTQRLDDRVIEILESEGAGPQTLGALQRLRDRSQLLPAAPEPPPGMTPPPPPSLEEEREIWQTTVALALQYTRSLPDFLCTETVYRWTDSSGNEQWQADPTVIADIAFSGGKEQYKLVSVGGKPSKQPMLEVGGTMSQGEFGSVLATIFKPASDTEHRWDHWTMLRKRATSVYFFRIAASQHPHVLVYGTPGGQNARAVVGEHGFVYIDRETNQVSRIIAEADEIPADFPVRKSRSVLDYDYAEIGGSRYFLPLRAELRLDTESVRNLNSVEFQKYRKFSASTRLNLDDGVDTVKK